MLGTGKEIVPFQYIQRDIFHGSLNMLSNSTLILWVIIKCQDNNNSVEKINQPLVIIIMITP